MKTLFIILSITVIAGCGAFNPVPYSSSVTTTETVRVTDQNGRVSSQEVVRETTVKGVGTGYGGGYGSTFIGIGGGYMPNCRPYWGCVR